MKFQIGFQRPIADDAAFESEAAITQPEIAVKQWFSFVGEMGKIVLGGASARNVEPGDKRFSDPAWKSSGLHQKLLQSYLAWGDAVNTFVDKVDLNDQDRARAKLVSQILVDAFSPTNGLVSNPAAMKKLVDTGGESFLAGL